MKKATIAILCMVLAIASGFASGSNESKDGSGLIDVKLGYMPNLISASLAAIGDAEGYFEEYGLDAELVKFTSGPPEFAAMAAGDLDAGIIGHGAHLLAIQGQAEIFYFECLGNSDKVMTRTDTGIKTAADLKGKTVSIGSSGSGVYYNALDILGAYGITESDIKPTYQSFGDSVDALQDGKIDAAFVVAGAPTVAVSTLATTHQVYLVSIDQEHLDNLLSSSPYYSPYTIKADVYGTPEDCQTVAVGAVVIARDDVSEDAVYDFVSTVFNDKDAIAQSHDKGHELDLAFATSITTVPYHPGAAKYFAEQGIEVPVK